MGFKGSFLRYQKVEKLGKACNHKQSLFLNADINSCHFMCLPHWILRPASLGGIIVPLFSWENQCPGRPCNLPHRQTTSQASKSYPKDSGTLVQHHPPPPHSVLFPNVISHIFIPSSNSFIHWKYISLLSIFINILCTLFIIKTFFWVLDFFSP